MRIRIPTPKTTDKWTGPNPPVVSNMEVAVNSTAEKSGVSSVTTIDREINGSIIAPKIFL
ncbi:hypothetical protein A5CBH24_05240 [Alistipes communis]|jgi:hypothetical protein|uniref:Uncharacterized protein n=1 Tax=Alistipes communis TaxID=2585118 RepID=A0A4Y1XPF8_9BACT|nr:hypothetical protein A5CBH24_05240 [Alistipes communis]BBL15247.1 hypothetical protein A6CPBBH3_18860 [Alistipes communis]